MTSVVHVQAHRDGCMCIICKQARRVGKTWGGMNGPPWQTPMLTQGVQGRPTPRFGKRAFLHALPQLVCGALKHKVCFQLQPGQHTYDTHLCMTHQKNSNHCSLQLQNTYVSDQSLSQSIKHVPCCIALIGS